MARLFLLSLILFFFSPGAAQEENGDKSLTPEILSSLVNSSMTSVGTCVVDVMQATQTLGQAGLSLNAASKNCVLDGGGSEKQKLRCGQDITRVLTSVAFSASFLSAAAAKCGKNLKIDAQCSGDISGFIASLGTVASAGIGIHTTCGGASQTSESSQVVALYDNATQQDTFDNVSCFFDHSQGLLYLSRAGLEISNAVKDCSSAELSNGEDARKATCSTRISGVINSFVFMASYFTMSIEHCPSILSFEHSKCAAAIINTVAGVAGVAATGSSFFNSCKDIDPKEPLEQIGGVVESGLEFLGKKTTA